MVMFSIISMDFFQLEAAQAGYLMSFFGVLLMVSAGPQAWAGGPGHDSVSLGAGLCTVILLSCLSEPPPHPQRVASALGLPWLCTHCGPTCRGPILEGSRDWGTLGLRSAAACLGTPVH